MDVANFINISKTAQPWWPLPHDRCDRRAAPYLPSYLPTVMAQIRKENVDYNNNRIEEAPMGP